MWGQPSRFVVAIVGGIILMLVSLWPEAANSPLRQSRRVSPDHRIVGYFTNDDGTVTECDFVLTPHDRPPLVDSLIRRAQNWGGPAAHYVEYRDNVGFGYPFPVVATWIAPNYSFTKPAVGQKNAKGKQVNRPIPAIMYDRILWPNLLANFAIYAGPLFGITAIPSVIRLHRRRKKNLCLYCGYDLRGATIDLCSECGTTIGQLRPDDKNLSPRIAKQANTFRLMLILFLVLLFGWVLHGEYQRRAMLTSYAEQWLGVSAMETESASRIVLVGVWWTSRTILADGAVAGYPYHRQNCRKSPRRPSEGLHDML